MTFGEYLKELRQAKGLSQKELSALTNGQVSNAEISRLEAGIRKKPSPAVLKILAPYLGVPVGALLTKAGYMDSLQGGDEAGAPAPGSVAAGGEPDSRLTARLKELEEENAALKADNQKLSEESGSLSRRCAQLEAANLELEDKCNFVLLQAAPSSQAGGGLEGEIQALREQNEAMKEENRRIKEETIVFLEEGSALRAEADSYRKKMSQAEETARKALLQLDAAEAELTALKENTAGAADTGGDADGALSKLRAEALDLQEHVDSLDKENLALRGQNEKLEKQLLEAREAGSQPYIPSGDDEKDQEIAALRGLMAEASARQEQIARERASVEQELRAAREMSNINAPILDAIRSVKVGSIDLGKIFTETVKGASPEDLETLGRLMQAMNKDAIRASDKKMLMDILKRFVK